MPNALMEADVDDMTAFEFTPEIPCDMKNCTHLAVGFLVCGVCASSREAECGFHRQRHSYWASLNPVMRIYFSKSCHHGPFYTNCAWEPLP